MLGPDGHPLSRKYYAENTGKDLDVDEVVRGYEVTKGTARSGRTGGALLMCLFQRNFLAKNFLVDRLTYHQYDAPH